MEHPHDWRSPRSFGLETRPSQNLEGLLNRFELFSYQVFHTVLLCFNRKTYKYCVLTYLAGYLYLKCLFFRFCHRQKVALDHQTISLIVDPWWLWWIQLAQVQPSLLLLLLVSKVVRPSTISNLTLKWLM